MLTLLPEYSEGEWPQHQWFPQLKLLPLFHDMAAPEDTGSIECREEKGLLPASNKKRKHDLLYTGKYTDRLMFNATN